LAVRVEVRKTFNLHLPAAFPHLPRVMRFDRGAIVDLSDEAAAHWFIQAQLRDNNLVIVDRSPAPKTGDQK
jgi:hypothetical protein